MADKIKPENIKPGDWVLFKQWESSARATVIGVVYDLSLDGSRVLTSEGLAFTADILEVRRG